MKSIVMGGATQLNKSSDSQVLQFGDAQLGYYGLVKGVDFLTLAEAVSISGINFGGNNPAVGADDWFKFAYQGKILYVAKQPLRSNMSRDQLGGKSLLDGKTVTVRGKQYSMKSMIFAEWQALMYHVHADHPNSTTPWASLSTEEMGLNYCGTITRTASQAIGYQSITQSGNITSSLVAATRGWRPMLELIG